MSDGNEANTAKQGSKLLQQDETSCDKEQGSPVAMTTSPLGVGRKARPLFGRLNQDLQHALSSWDTLTEEVAHKISPEEEQLHEVKRLLSELKSKLSEFED